MGKVRSLGKPSRVGVFVYSPIYAARHDITSESARTYAVNPLTGDYFGKYPPNAASDLTCHTPLLENGLFCDYFNSIRTNHLAQKNAGGMVKSEMLR